MGGDVPIELFCDAADHFAEPFEFGVNAFDLNAHFVNLVFDGGDAAAEACEVLAESRDLSSCPSLAVSNRRNSAVGVYDTFL